MRRRSPGHALSISTQVELWFLARFEAFLFQCPRGWIRQRALAWIDSRHLQIRCRLARTSREDGSR
ncbi:MAG TPA: hypothetical protein VMU69_03455 [Bradyrhizobium sp.]|nr:hypothetical protein [Bradyrhizobium sp.]